MVNKFILLIAISVLVPISSAAGWTFDNNAQSWTHSNTSIAGLNDGDNFNVDAGFRASEGNPPGSLGAGLSGTESGIPNPKSSVLTWTSPDFSVDEIPSSAFLSFDIKINNFTGAGIFENLYQVTLTEPDGSTAVLFPATVIASSSNWTTNNVSVLQTDFLQPGNYRLNLIALLSTDTTSGSKNIEVLWDNINITFIGGIPTNFTFLTPPVITSFSPSSPVNDSTAPANRTFSIAVNQSVNVFWILDGAVENFTSGTISSSFTFTNVGAGRHIVKAIAFNSNGSAEQNWEWNINFTPGIISGYKINDTDGNGLWDAGEARIKGWNITLAGAVSSLTVSTDASGFYKFDNLPAGTYVVSEESRGGWIPTSYPWLVVALAPGVMNSTNNNFTNIPVTTPTPTPTPTAQPTNGTITGTVTNASSGSAISGATLTADGITATTNATGGYSISIAPGNYTVTASATGYQSSNATVTVISGATVTRNFALTPTPPGANGIITGTVTNASSGSAISGATVTPDGTTATTNATGGYSISIAPGNYTVTASATGYQSSNATVTVAPGATVIRNFALQPVGVVNNFTINLLAGFNLISVPLNESSITKVSSLATKVGTNVTEIVKWDSTTQQFVSFVPGIPLNDFDVTGGEGYFVNLNNPTTVKFSGRSWAPEGNFVMSLSSDLNLIGLPVNDPSITSASTLAPKIGANVTEIVKWDGNAQQYVSFVPGIPLNNFDIIGGEGYFVNLNNPTVVAFTGNPWSN